MIKSKLFYVICIIFSLTFWVTPYNSKDLIFESAKLQEKYNDYFQYKNNHSLENVYTQYTKLSPVDMISLNIITDYHHKGLLNAYTDSYVEEYYNLTNNSINPNLSEEVQSRMNEYINEYKIQKSYLNIGVYILLIISSIVISNLIYFIFNIFRKISTKNNS